MNPRPKHRPSHKKSIQYCLEWLRSNSKLHPSTLMQRHRNRLLSLMEYWKRHSACLIHIRRKNIVLYCDWRTRREIWSEQIQKVIGSWDGFHGSGFTFCGSKKATGSIMIVTDTKLCFNPEITLHSTALQFLGFYVVLTSKDRRGGEKSTLRFKDLTGQTLCSILSVI